MAAGCGHDHNDDSSSLRLESIRLGLKLEERTMVTQVVRVYRTLVLYSGLIGLDLVDKFVLIKVLDLDEIG